MMGSESPSSLDPAGTHGSVETMGFGLRKAVGTFQDLARADDADSQAVLAELLEKSRAG